MAQSHELDLQTGSAALQASIALQVPRLADFRITEKSSLVSPVVLQAVVQVVETLLIIVVGLVIAKAYVEAGDVEASLLYWPVLLATSLSAVAMFQMLGLYTTRAFASIRWTVPGLLLGWTIAIGLLVVTVFFLKAGPDISRVWLALWFAVGGVALVTGRVILTLMTREWINRGRLNRRAVIYGGGTACEDLIARLEADVESDIRICGVFDDRGSSRVSSQIAGYPNLGRLSDLLAFGRKTRVDMVILSLPLTAERRLIQLQQQIRVMPVDIRLAATASRLRFCKRSYSFIGSVPMIDLHDKPLTDWAGATKWLFDKLIGGIAIFLLAPVLAAVATAIKLDSRGPVLFRQKRYGFNNELIEVYKFRSMYHEATDATASKLVTRDDKRVTRVGRFIRKTSLDELPQLLNVLNGTLSLVGPRPHALQAKADDRLYGDVVADYFARHRVKPGITGWAQINGWRGETDTADKIQKRVEHDLYYIENWSLLFDMYILARTPFALLSFKNAY